MGTVIKRIIRREARRLLWGKVIYPIRNLIVLAIITAIGMSIANIILHFI